jgi:hypothetical protein
MVFLNDETAILSDRAAILTADGLWNKTGKGRPSPSYSWK